MTWEKTMPRYDKITPEGTRDMLFEECAVQNEIRDGLRRIFEEKDYREVKTPGFEFYDVFSAKSDYYPQDSVYKFSDTAGRLVTVRPDSTIPIARMTATKLKGHALPIRLWYAQRVYRQQQALRGRSGEIMQMGVELIGASTFDSDIEMLTMAAASQQAASPSGYRMEIGHVGFYNLLMGDLKASDEERELIHRYVASKNYARVSDVLERYPAGRTTEILRQLPRLFGSMDALKEASALCAGYNPRLTDMLEYLEKLFGVLRERGLEDRIMIDFGLINQEEYYSSLVFRGYLESTGAPVLSGGRYDQLFRDFGEDLPATGFAMNLDLLTAAALREMEKRDVSQGAQPDRATGKLRVALTKGRLEERFVERMEKAGYDCSAIRDKGRKLLLTVPGTDIEIFLAKAPDVITYVEHGVCDIGIVGKDTIVEQGGTYYEILDLGIGRCRFALAAPAGRDFFSGFGTKVVATKYPNVAGRYFEGKGMDVEIIKIEGSVELAPILALADGIVDIVETGSTLRENGLAIVEEIRNVSARLIVNVTGMKLKKDAVAEFAERLAAAL
jgi:ATP phosphoribosyltransferase regulatory subunit